MENLIKPTCKKCQATFEPSKEQKRRGSALRCKKCSGGGKPLSDGRIFSDVKRVIQLLGHRPTATEYREYGKHFGPICKRFGGLAGLYEKMGIRFERKYRYKREPVEKLIDDIKRVRIELGHYPSRAEYETNGRYSYGTLLKRMGKKYWDEVVVSVFGLGLSDAIQLTPKHRWNKEMWECYIRNFAKENGRLPSRADVPVRVVREVCGFPSLKELLKALCILVTKPKEKKSVVGVNDDLILADLKRVCVLTGYPLSHLDYKKLGTYNTGGVLRRFRLQDGNRRWEGVLNALEASGVEVSSRLTQYAPKNIKHMSHVEDPVRDRLKQSSVEAIKEFFQSK